MGNHLRQAARTFDDIRALAADTGENHGIYDAQGHADLNLLLDALGGTVRRSEGPDMLVLNTLGSFRVHVHGMQSDRRARFEITHALAVYVLECASAEKTVAQSFSRGDRGRLTVEANVFAAALLMPEAPFRDAWATHAGNDWKVSNQFGVSPLAALTRAQTLELVLPAPVVDDPVLAVLTAAARAEAISDVVAFLKASSAVTLAGRGGAYELIAAEFPGASA
jgi:hypothetical protein